MLVARNSVILEIPPHHRLQPLQGVLDGLVPALLELCLDFFQLGCHALSDGLSSDLEEARLLARPSEFCQKGYESWWLTATFTSPPQGRGGVGPSNPNTAPAP